MTIQAAMTGKESPFISKKKVTEILQQEKVFLFLQQIFNRNKWR